eukprot:768796-Hanusia_phi.AAC.6
MQLVKTSRIPFPTAGYCCAGCFLLLIAVRQVENSGIDAKPAVHFVLEAAEPNGPLRTARTYFLSEKFAGGFLTLRHRWTGNGGAGVRVRTFDWDGNETQQEDNRLDRAGRSAYARYLMMAYCAVMQVHDKLVKSWCEGSIASVSDLKKSAISGLKDLELDWFRNHDFESDLDVQLSAFDNIGNPVEVVRGSPYMKYLKVSMYHVKSLDQNPIDLGAVCYGDTFLDLRSSSSHPTRSSESRPLNITSSIQRHQGWILPGQEEDTDYMHALLARLQASKRNRHNSMGALLLDSPLEGFSLCTHLKEIPRIFGDLWVLERGLIFSSHQLGSLALDFKHDVSSCEFFNVDFVAREDCDLAFAVFEVKEGTQRYGITEVSLSPRNTRLVLASSASDRRKFARDVCTAWKSKLEEEAVSVRVLDKEELDGKLFLEANRIVLDAQSASRKGEVDAFVRSYRELEALVMCPGPSQDVERKESEAEEELVVLVGQPCCDKTRLLEKMIEISGDRNLYDLITYSSTNCSKEDLEGLRQCLVEHASSHRGIFVSNSLPLSSSSPLILQLPSPLLLLSSHSLTPFPSPPPLLSFTVTCRKGACPPPLYLQLCPSYR